METQEAIDMHERVKGLEVSVETILTNHLPHLKQDIAVLNDRMEWAIKLIIGAALMNGIIEFFIK